MKCDRRWYYDGRYERECAEHRRLDDEKRNVKRWRNADGDVVYEEWDGGAFYAPRGLKAFLTNLLPMVVSDLATQRTFADSWREAIAEGADE